MKIQRQKHNQNTEKKGKGWVEEDGVKEPIPIRVRTIVYPILVLGKEIHLGTGGHDIDKETGMGKE